MPYCGEQCADHAWRDVGHAAACDKYRPGSDDEDEDEDDATESACADEEGLARATADLAIREEHVGMNLSESVFPGARVVKRDEAIRLIGASLVEQIGQGIPIVVCRSEAIPAQHRSRISKSVYATPQGLLLISEGGDGTSKDDYQRAIRFLSMSKNQTIKIDGKKKTVQQTVISHFVMKTTRAMGSAEAAKVGTTKVTTASDAPMPRRTYTVLDMDQKEVVAHTLSALEAIGKRVLDKLGERSSNAEITMMQQHLTKFLDDKANEKIYEHAPNCSLHGVTTGLRLIGLVLRGSADRSKLHELLPIKLTWLHELTHIAVPPTIVRYSTGRRHRDMHGSDFHYGMEVLVKAAVKTGDLPDLFERLSSRDLTTISHLSHSIDDAAGFILDLERGAATRAAKRAASESSTTETSPPYVPPPEKQQRPNPVPSDAGASGQPPHQQPVPPVPPFVPISYGASEARPAPSTSTSTSQSGDIPPIVSNTEPASSGPARTMPPLVPVKTAPKPAGPAPPPADPRIHEPRPLVPYQPPQAQPAVETPPPPLPPVVPFLPPASRSATPSKPPPALIKSYKDGDLDYCTAHVVGGPGYRKTSTFRSVQGLPRISGDAIRAFYRKSFPDVRRVTAPMIHAIYGKWVPENFAEWYRQAVENSPALSADRANALKELKAWHAATKVDPDEQGEEFIEAEPPRIAVMHSGWLVDVPGLNPKRSEKGYCSAFGVDDSRGLVLKYAGMVGKFGGLVSAIAAVLDKNKLTRCNPTHVATFVVNAAIYIDGP
jgi:hypothetical protein